MSSKVWPGWIFVKYEGGYEIILKSLDHYKRRLKTMGNSPEMKDAAAMFAAALQQEARKTVPKIDETIARIKGALSENQPSLAEEDISLIQKALACYHSDITKAQDTGHEYFLDLVGDLSKARHDMWLITAAQKRISWFTE